VQERLQQPRRVGAMVRDLLSARHRHHRRHVQLRCSWKARWAMEAPQRRLLGQQTLRCRCHAYQPTRCGGRAMAWVWAGPQEFPPTSSRAGEVEVPAPRLGRRRRQIPPLAAGREMWGVGMVWVQARLQVRWLRGPGSRGQLPLATPAGGESACAQSRGGRGAAVSPRVGVSLLGAAAGAHPGPATQGHVVPVTLPTCPASGGCAGAHSARSVTVCSHAFTYLTSSSCAPSTARPNTSTFAASCRAA